VSSLVKKLKRIIWYLILIFVFVKCFKIVFVPKIIQTVGDEEKLLNSVYKKFDYGDYTEIRLLHTNTGEVETLPLDIYLYGVVASEMPVSFEEEALKAQAVVARTYTIFKIMNGSKHEDNNADICDSSFCCQAWISKENRMARWEENERQNNWSKIENAVNSTIGKVILYQGQPINAFFHSNSGGATELPVNVWGGSYPYLQSVETIGEDAYSSYLSEVVVSKDELSQKMHDKYSDFDINYEDENAIQILEYTEGMRVKTLKIGNKEMTGVDARSIFELKSAKFEVKFEGDNIIFSVLGYGHGVGLSQCGSDSLAKQGYNYIDIIKYYYKDVEINE